MITGTDLLTVERALQVALAPAFVIGGVMALLNLLNTRMQRIVDRERELRDQASLDSMRLAPLLQRRGRITFAAILCCICACIALSLLVIVSFVEPLFGIGAGVHVVTLLVIGMALLTAGLVLFLLDMLIATRGAGRGDV
jgi:hypothetical protein